MHDTLRPSPSQRRERWYHHRHLVWRVVLVLDAAVWVLLLLGLKLLFG